jgi:hypothetical protein
VLVRRKPARLVRSQIGSRDTLNQQWNVMVLDVIDSGVERVVES